LPPTMLSKLAVQKTFRGMFVGRISATSCWYRTSTRIFNKVKRRLAASCIHKTSQWITINNLVATHTHTKRRYETANGRSGVGSPRAPSRAALPFGGMKVHGQQVTGRREQFEWSREYFDHGFQQNHTI
jgi:hypothetical protein